MRLNMPFVDFCRVFLDTNTPPGAAPVSEPPQPEPKKFTQAEVDAIVKDRVKNKNRELTLAQREIDQLKKDVEELKKQITTPPTPTGDPNDPKNKGELDLITQRFERQIDELKNQLADAKKQTDSEKDARLKTERDKELGDALQAVGCTDHKGGRRYFLPQIEWDDVENKWSYRMANGNLVSIIDGVTEELPDYWKPAAMRTGGSGSSGNTPKRLAKKNELDAAKQKLAELTKKAAENRGNTALVAQCETQRKLIKKLEAEYANG